MTRHDPFASINQTHICHGESQTKPKGYPSGPANAMQCDASLSVHRMWRIRRRIAGLARRAALRCHATHDVYPTIHVQRPASHPHRRARSDAHRRRPSLVWLHAANNAERHQMDRDRCTPLGFCPGRRPGTQAIDARMYWRAASYRSTRLVFWIRARPMVRS